MFSIATMPSVWQPSVVSVGLLVKCTLQWLPKNQTNMTPGANPYYTNNKK